MAYRLIIIIIAVVFLCRYSLMRLFGRFIVSAQTQPLIEAFVPFRHDGMITSCTKTCQRAGRRRQNELIFYCCCSHTTPTTSGTGLYFHTGSHFFYKRQTSALRCRASDTAWIIFLSATRYSWCSSALRILAA